MVDAALIQQCADPGLKPAIVERFIAEAGSDDPLAITVRAGDRVVLVPQPKTADEAMELIREYIGRAVVRVGVTQYPAGVGVANVSELKLVLVDACDNIGMGTALFRKVYRIVTKWYGNGVDEAFDDAVDAWKTGYFEGTAVFTEPDPGSVTVAIPEVDGLASDADPGEATNAEGQPRLPEGAPDPNQAGIRIDLSGIGGHGQ